MGGKNTAGSFVGNCGKWFEIIPGFVLTKTRCGTSLNSQLTDLAPMRHMSNPLEFADLHCMEYKTEYISAPQPGLTPVGIIPRPSLGSSPFFALTALGLVPFLCLSQDFRSSEWQMFRERENPVPLSLIHPALSTYTPPFKTPFAMFLGGKKTINL